MNYRLKMALITIVAAALVWVSHRERDNSIEQKSEVLKQRLINDKFNPIKNNIKNIFTLGYQTNRTIALLPSVRAITGGNRRSDEEDILELGRFSKEGNLTVQQLYNNLATNVDVSEIYCVVTGLDYKSGEVPFFMYDQIIVQKGGNETGGGTHSEDFPEELEDEEYDYYPLQIDYFKKEYPKFNFATLPDIPTISSKPLRTCDNSQYQSKSKGDAYEASGILYSTPFYDLDKNLKGIISSVFRLNVFEAVLVDVPYLIITEEDARNAAKDSFKMPTKPSNFILTNKEKGIEIYDRRNGAILKKVNTLENGDRTSSDTLFSEALDIKDNSEWRLYYEYEGEELERISNAANSLFWAKVFVIILLTIILVIWVRQAEKKKRLLFKIAQMLKRIAQGDLTKKMSGEGEGEVGQIIKWYNNSIDSLNGLVGKLAKTISLLRESSQDMAVMAVDLDDKSEVLKARSVGIANSTNSAQESSADIANEAKQVSKKIKNIATVIEEMSSSITEVAQQCNSEKGVVEGADQKAKSAQLQIGELTEASDQITKSVEMITGISDMINLLALNATIEAASAGEKGRGFAVVANEVKELSNRTVVAVEEIHTKINQMNECLGDAVNEIEGISVNMGALSNFANKLFTIVEDQSSTMNQLLGSISESDTAASDIASHVFTSVNELKDIASSSTNVSMISTETSDKVKKLKNDSDALSYTAKELEEVVSKFNLLDDE